MALLLYHEHSLSCKRVSQILGYWTCSRFCPATLINTTHWAFLMAQLLTKAWDEVKAARAAGPFPTSKVVDAYRQRASELLQLGRMAQPPPVRGTNKRMLKSKALNLITHFEKQAESIWRFVSDPAVLYDNKLAERSIRMQ